MTLATSAATRARTPPVMAAINPVPLRVVLFGPAGAGKTTLLGALAETVQMEPATVAAGRSATRDPEAGRSATRDPEAGRSATPGVAAESSPAAQTSPTLSKDLFTASPSDLKGLRDLRSTPVPRTEPIVVYSITYQSNAGQSHPVEILDCDGQVAEKLLTSNLTAPDDHQAALADKIIQADVLVLAIDVAASPTRLDELFASFRRFLRALEEARGERVEVSGLPVFLVLTRCDLLARPSDTLVGWLERIEEHKRTVEGHFRDFLTRTSAEPGGPFGDIHLRLWATAVRRPSLAGSTARAPEPFGVTELFRQCCEEGLAYRAAQRQSGRRLALALAGVGGLVLLLLGLSIGLLLQKPPRPLSPLEQRVEALRFADRPTAAQRLAEPATVVEGRLAQFEEVRANPGFGQLPEDARAFVLLREEELTRYLRMRDQVLARQPADATSLEELEATRTALAEIALPADWAPTEVARERARLLDEANRLLQAAELASDWFDRSSAKAAAMLRGDHYRGRVIVWNEWYKDAQALLAPTRGPGARPAPRPEDPIEGTGGLHWALVLAYPEVAEKAAAWAEKKKQLEQTTLLVAELGLVRLPGKKQPLLTFDDDFSLKAAEQRLQELRASAPLLLEPGLRLDTLGLGQAAQAELDAKAREQYQFLLGLERQVLLARFKEYDPTNNTESKERWAFVAEGLPPGGDLVPAWVKLAGVLARLQAPPAPLDPVADLRSFLKPDKVFSLWARTIQLEIPPSVGVSPQPGARLRVFLGPPDKPVTEETEVMVFDLLDQSGGPPQTATFLYQR